MKEEKICCPRCEKTGKKREMFYLPGREDRPAQYFCYACDYTSYARQDEAEEKQVRRRIICY